MSRLGGVGKAERLNLVLHDIWESEQTALVSGNLAKILNGSPFIFDTEVCTCRRILVLRRKNEWGRGEGGSRIECLPARVS